MTQIDFTENNDTVEFLEESQFSIVWKLWEVDKFTDNIDVSLYY